MIRKFNEYTDIRIRKFNESVTTIYSDIFPNINSEIFMELYDSGFIAYSCKEKNVDNNRFSNRTRTSKLAIELIFSTPLSTDLYDANTFLDNIYELSNTCKVIINRVESLGYNIMISKFESFFEHNSLQFVICKYSIDDNIELLSNLKNVLIKGYKDNMSDSYTVRKLHSNSSTFNINDHIYRSEILKDELKVRIHYKNPKLILPKFEVTNFISNGLIDFYKKNGIFMCNSSSMNSWGPMYKNNVTKTYVDFFLYPEDNK